MNSFQPWILGLVSVAFLVLDGGSKPSPLPSPSPQVTAAASAERSPLCDCGDNCKCSPVCNCGAASVAQTYPDPAEEKFPDPTWVSIVAAPDAAPLEVGPPPESSIVSLHSAQIEQLQNVMDVKVLGAGTTKWITDPKAAVKPVVKAPVAAPVATGQWVQQRGRFGRRGRMTYQSCGPGGCN